MNDRPFTELGELEGGVAFMYLWYRSRPRRQSINSSILEKLTEMPIKHPSGNIEEAIRFYSWMGPG